MAKKKKIKKIEKEEVEINKELVDFEQALKTFKYINKYKALLMDVEIVKIFTQKRIPELKATQEDFNKVFKKF